MSAADEFIVPVMFPDSKIAKTYSSGRYAIKLYIIICCQICYIVIVTV